MKYITAKPEHFELLELRDQEKNYCLCDPASGAKIQATIENSIATTMVHDGRIICIMGFYELWPGVINIWLFPSIYAPKHPIPFLRSVKRCVNRIKEDMKPHRVQTLSIQDELHINWMTFLGFKPEGVL